MSTLALLDGDGLVYKIGFSTQDIPLGQAIARMRSAIDTIAFVGARADSYRGFLSPRGSTFRHRLARRQKYKGNREGNEKPVHYEGLREYLQERECFEMAVDEEADDQLGINLVALGENAICCSPDKDLDNVPGWHYNPNRRERYYVTRRDALTNFYRQCLVGDRTDNIPGVDGIGPKGAQTILPGGEDENDMAAKVLITYYMAGMTDEDLEEAGRLLWIRHLPGQVWSLPL